MNQPLLFRFGFLSTPAKDILAVVVFILDRIMVADLRTTPREVSAFGEAAKNLQKLTGYSADNFAEELQRQAELITHHGLSDAILVRLTREAISWLDENLRQEQLNLILDSAADVALSDERLHKRELMILYDLAQVSIRGFNQLKSWLIRFHDACTVKYPPDHPVTSVLQEIWGITDLPTANARLKLIKRPDEVRGIVIPPLSFTYHEFADWLTTISLLRASQHRQAPMNQTRIVYASGDLIIQKGLIKWSAISGAEDDQLEEGHRIVHKWCQAVKAASDSIPFPDGQIFSAVIFGSNGDSFADCCIPNHRRPDQWYITCAKNEESIDVHAIDVSGDNHSVYWCPEMADEISRRLGIGMQLLDGTYPFDPEGRKRLLKVTKHLF